MSNISNLINLNKNLLPDNIDFAEYYEKAKHSTTILQGSAFVLDAQQLINDRNNKTGSVLPWAKTHDDIQFNSGVSVWAGINSHGKSTMLFQACIGFQKQGHTVCLASLEMEGGHILHTLSNQAAGCEASAEYVAKYADWAGERLQIYNAVGYTKQEDMLGAIIWAAENRNVTHFVVDNLMMLTDGDIGERAMNSQKYFVSRCKDIARDHKIHIHIVHHIKKVEDEKKVPTKMEVMGGMSISNMVDYLFIVWKNKERARYFHTPPAYRTFNQELEDAAGAMLVCEKHRKTGVERKYGLWFDTKSQQFLNSKNEKPYRMVDA
jgi:twinkle protein